MRPVFAKLIKKIVIYGLILSAIGLCLSYFYLSYANDGVFYFFDKSANLDANGNCCVENFDSFISRVLFLIAGFSFSLFFVLNFIIYFLGKSK